MYHTCRTVQIDGASYPPLGRCPSLTVLDKGPVRESGAGPDPRYAEDEAEGGPRKNAHVGK